MAEREPDEERRSFLSRASAWAMGLGLIGGYGTFAAIAGRFLYPARRQRRQWMFAADLAGFSVGGARSFRGPAGELINIVRHERGGDARDFIALSSTCPHLGCQVHWEGHNDRYFCPCHNGTFDAAGVGTGGPPGDAGLSLPRYPLKVENDLLFVELPTETLVADARLEPFAPEACGPCGAGHDPCLGARRPLRRADGSLA